MNTNTAITVDHKKRFDEIKKRLTELGHKESSFVQVELLFYEVLSIAKGYGDDQEDNVLLYDMRKLQGDAYQNTKQLFKKSTQREQKIRKFIVEFKKVLSVK